MGRTLSQINRHIKHGATRYPNQLTLRHGMILKMQPTQCSFVRSEALIVLHKL